MDSELIQIPGIGNIARGKLLLVKTRDAEYQGYLQTCGEFLTMWTKKYLHAVRFSEINYIGLEYEKPTDEPGIETGTEETE